MTTLLGIKLLHEYDVVLARQRARQIAGLLGLAAQDQSRVATAVSELARNAFRYAHGGRVAFSLTDAPEPSLVVTVDDDGPGIADLQRVLDGDYRSTTGAGIGLRGARRLMDRFEIGPSPSGGTHVAIGKRVPVASATAQVARITEELGRQRPTDPVEEVQAQNQELLRSLDEVRAAKDEVERQRRQLAETNRELEDTNRGVVALYAELDERADYLKRTSEVKSRFLSNMTHEFRTPVHSIVSLSRMLLDHIDGPLNAEQRTQVTFIQQAAQSLLELVNDLLDLAKVEAGKITVKPAEFRVSELFGTLRGMLRPLLEPNSSVSLSFDEAEGLPALYTDESKVSQILRNFISNALKYTERGEVRVSASVEQAGSIVFSVRDTGIGIALEDQERIFDDFEQVDSPLQKHVKGTGLGLPLSRRLAHLLGGSVRVQSELGKGSTFYAVIPTRLESAAESVLVPEVQRAIDPTRSPVLVVEDNAETLFVYEKYLKGSPFQPLPARSIDEARHWLRRVRPVAILLDVLLGAESSWGFLAELKAAPQTARIPVAVATVVDNEGRAQHHGADAFLSKPVERALLLSTLTRLTEKHPQDTILIVDDDEISRYLLRGMLADARLAVAEAENGQRGVERARTLKPRAIFLDLTMPDASGFTILRELKADPATAQIPVIVYTGRILTDQERQQLTGAAAILSKESASRETAMSRIRAALASAGVSLEGSTHG